MFVDYFVVEIAQFGLFLFPQTRISVAIEELRAAAEACAARKGVHLIDLVVRGTRGRAVVEAFIDAEQGVTSDVCADVSREITEVIERSDWLTGSYRLDVSSPGIERPLRFPWQYRKHIGRILTVTCRTAEGTAQKSGTLVSTDDACIVLDPGKGKAAETILFDALMEAMVKAPW
jgi:ribosome maturation factor RimP